MHFKHFVMVFGLCLVGNLFAQVQDPFMRYPSISPDGQTLAFSYQGDIWTVPVDGGRAARLTLNEAYEANPKWHPDGNKIAFTSDRFGSSDIFVVDADGSAPKRLTYHSQSDHLSGWTPNGEVIFNSTRQLPFGWESEIYTVSQNGGTPARLTNGLGEAPSMSPNGEFVAFVRGAAKNERKRYRGPANLEIWVWNQKSDAYFQITNFAGNDYQPVWAGNDQLLFISEADGTYNLYQVGINNDGSLNGTPKQLTTFKEDGVRHFGRANNGTIVLEKDTHIYTMAANGKPKKVSVSVPGDQRFLDQTSKTFSSGASEIAPSPKEEFLAMVIRGEIFIHKNDTEKARTIRLTDHPFRDRDIQWHGEEAIIFASDRMGGQYDLFALESAEEDQPSLYKTLSYKVTQLTKTPEDEREPVVSPDGKKITFSRGDNETSEFIVAELKEDHNLGKETVLHKGWNQPSDIDWSPDSKWIAYSQQDLQFNSEIFIRAADGSKDPVNVTFHPRNDFAPTWSADGSKLGFLSSRNNGDVDVWFVWLKRQDWEKTKQDWDEDDDEEPKAKKKKKEASKDGKDKDEEGEEAEEEMSIVIDFKDLHNRLQQVTSMPGDETGINISKDGETFYFLANSADKRDIFKVKWDGTELKKLASGSSRGGSLIMGSQHKYLYFAQSQGSLSRIDLKKSKKQGLRYKAKMNINHRAERQQVYNEGWRTMYQSFYDPNFHGVNWEKLGKKYKTWAMKASTNQDFQDVFNMLLGELNASHLGLYNSDRYETANQTTGLLGVQVTMGKDGAKVDSVLPFGPADREKSRLNPGDVITKIDGKTLSQQTNIYQHLNNTVSERVRLEVKNSSGDIRQVVIRPTRSTRTLHYDAFVESRRKMVAEYSKGRLGYVHVRGMNWPSFEAFERAITAEGYGKDGLVIDVRYNGGGWTTDYLLAVLSVRQHAYTIPRGASKDLKSNHKKFSNFYPYSERLPLAGWAGPAVTLCNQFSYSNAEIFSHAFQSLGRGPLVGQPTFGAVISTGGRGLLGDAFIRMPFRGWFVKKSGMNMENGPAVPDQIVADPPGALLGGQDPQLKTAVESLLKDIESR